MAFLNFDLNRFAGSNGRGVKTFEGIDTTSDVKPPRPIWLHIDDAQRRFCIVESRVSDISSTLHVSERLADVNSIIYSAVVDLHPLSWHYLLCSPHAHRPLLACLCAFFSSSYLSSLSAAVPCRPPCSRNSRKYSKEEKNNDEPLFSRPVSPASGAELPERALNTYLQPLSHLPHRSCRAADYQCIPLRHLHIHSARRCARGLWVMNGLAVALVLLDMCTFLHPLLFPSNVPDAIIDFTPSRFTKYLVVAAYPFLLPTPIFVA
ncbi:hypothetical protein C8R45DRAFT_1006772 [Mycena sanguinolenta]|nr:hypothetical protein C8R45DRAFT_1006772 [Mycena sanguinolenta]